MQDNLVLVVAAASWAAMVASRSGGAARLDLGNWTEPIHDVEPTHEAEPMS
jgi:hypothetical protein